MLRYKSRYLHSITASCVSLPQQSILLSFFPPLYNQIILLSSTFSSCLKSSGNEWNYTELLFHFLAWRNSFLLQSSLAWPFARVMIEALLRREDSWWRHMSSFPPLRSISLHCELTEPFCLSQGTVWAKQRPGNVCTTMITGARRGPTRAALSAARVKRTSGCIATPLGSTPQGPSSW